MRRYDTAVPVGSGGTSDVFKAYDAHLQRFVALKFLRRADPGHIQRMQHEARAQARLDHEGICKVYDVGEIEGRAYISMEYIEGDELTVAARHMSLEDKVEAARKIASAIHAAHEAELVHRDLKPSNIMVESKSSDGLRPVVIDFGLVWEEGFDGGTRDEQVVGTPPYLAPEQVERNGRSVGPRADIYGLGATFYELFTGVAPFKGTSSVDLLVKTVKEQPKRLRSVTPMLPTALETIVLKCLEKDPDRRYGSARALADDFAKFQRGEPISARPLKALERLQRWVGRERALVAIVALSLVALASAANVTVSGLRAERRLLLEQEYAQLGRDLEGMIRAAHMSEAHDIRPDRERVRRRIESLATDLEATRELAPGAADFALGRAYLALLDDAQASEHLSRAWQAGYRAPEVGYALGLSLGRQYEKALARAKHTKDPALRRFRLRSAAERFRAPALDYLRVARNAETVVPEHVEALLALFEERYSEALEKAQVAQRRTPWRYELHLLEGDILARKGRAVWARGNGQEGRTSLESAVDTYQRVTTMAPSDPRAYIGLCHAANLSLLLELESDRSSADLAELRKRGRNACGSAAEIDPDDGEPLMEEAMVEILWSRYRAWTSQEVEGDGAKAALDRALRLSRRALELAPGDAEAHFILGMAERMRAEHQLIHWQEDPRPALRAARSAFEQALELHPEEPAYLGALGVALMHRSTYEVRRGTDNFETLKLAAGYLQDSLAIVPETYSANYNLASAQLNLAYAQFGKGHDFIDQALSARHHMGRALEIRPRSGWGHAILGKIHLLLAHHAFLTGEPAKPRLDAALADLSRARELQPANQVFAVYELLVLKEWAWFRMVEDVDPTEPLEAALATAAELESSGYDTPDLQYLRARLHLVAMRWALSRGSDALPQLKAARQSIAELRRFPRNVVGEWVAARVAVWNAYWRLSRGLDSGLVEARALVDQLVAEQPDGEDAALLLGALEVLASFDQPTAAEQRETGARATASLEAAVSANRWLHPDVEPWLLWAREIEQGRFRRNFFG